MYSEKVSEFKRAKWILVAICIIVFVPSIIYYLDDRNLTKKAEQQRADQEWWREKPPKEKTPSELGEAAFLGGESLRDNPYTIFEQTKRAEWQRGFIDKEVSIESRKRMRLKEAEYIKQAEQIDERRKSKS